MNGIRTIYRTVGLLAALTTAIAPTSRATAQIGRRSIELVSTVHWIKQLGSAKFAEREAATQSLKSLGTKALGPLREAAKQDKEPEIRRQAAQIADEIENSLDGLLETYRTYGLPLPPAGARLVRFSVGTCVIDIAKGTSAKVQLFGFVLRPATKEKPPRLLVGTEEYLPTDQRLQLVDVDPEAALIENLHLQWHSSGFETNSAMATALQCKALGWNRLAQAMWDRCARVGAGHDYSVFFHPPNLSPRREIAQLAWTHLGNELSRPSSDRAAIRENIKALMKAEPALASEANKSLLYSLELSLISSNAIPGSVERLIDDLVELSEPGAKPYVQDPGYRRLFELGFAAAPALIEHLDDQRLTRVIHSGFNNSPPRLCLIGELAHHVLFRLAGFDVIRSWRNGHDDPNGEKEDARDWFAEAQKTGEESYFAKHIIPKDLRDERFNEDMLRLIALKYPKQLPKIYQTTLEKRLHMASGSVAEALFESTLPRPEKVALFSYVARNERAEDRRVALDYLRRLDPKIVDGHLKDILKSMPRRPADTYGYGCLVGSAELALLSDNSDVWAIFTDIAKGEDIAMRVHFIRSIGRDEKNEGLRRREIEFLSKFLNDEGVTKLKLGSEGVGYDNSGSWFLTVQDLAAYELSSMLHMKAKPDPNWTKVEWTALRGQVGEQLKHDQVGRP